MTNGKPAVGLIVPAAADRQVAEDTLFSPGIATPGHHFHSITMFKVSMHTIRRCPREHVALEHSLKPLHAAVARMGPHQQTWH